MPQVTDAKRAEVTKAAVDAVEHHRFLAVGEQSSAKAFFTSLALSLQPEPKWGLGTMATNGKKLYFDPEFTMSLVPAERHGVVIAHEPFHNGYNHFDRIAGLDNAQIRNIAQDAEINPVIIDAGYKLPSDAILPGRRPFDFLPPDETSEVYYKLLLAKAKEMGYSGKDGDPLSPEWGQGTDPGRCGVCIEAPDQATQDALDASWQAKVAGAAQDAQSRGSLPGALQRYVDRLLHPTVPWQAVLLDFIVTTCQAGGENNWARPTRRTAGCGFYMPSKRSDDLPRIVVAIDTSGSIDDEMLAKFGGELNGVLECRPAGVDIVYCDSKVNHVDHWGPGQGEFRLKAYGGGGTHHDPVMNYVLDMEDPPVCVICLTDGYTAVGVDPGVPVLWGVIPGGRKEFPFGRVVDVK